jgi:hypothetical protein
MKPSFASTLETVAPTTDAREALIDRLSDPKGQLQYLILFCRYMEKNYGDRTWDSPTDKLRFYASAYNCGYWKPAAYIHKMARRPCYRISELSNERWCYADIAAWYFDHRP